MDANRAQRVEEAYNDAVKNIQNIDSQAQQLLEGDYVVVSYKALKQLADAARELARRTSQDPNADQTEETGAIHGTRKTTTHHDTGHSKHTAKDDK